MITAMHIENFKCFKDFDIDLGPFNVLVGPNDSGKTAFLQAMAMLGGDGPNRAWDLNELTAKVALTAGTVNLWRSDTNSPILIQANGKAWEYPGSDRRFMEVTSHDGTNFRSKVQVHPDPPPVPPEREKHEPTWLNDWIREAIGSISYYAFDPSDLRRPTPLITDTFHLTRSGLGLSTFLQDVSNEDRKAFFALEQAFYERFPDYERILMPKEKVGGHIGYALKLHTRHGNVLPAESVSDGVMLALAYTALCYQPQPPGVLLIEEPETGVHYTSLKQIVGMLKGLSCDKHVQIILTTHSPYLLDCVEPEEVHVFSKVEGGAVRAARLSEHRNVAELKKYLMTGEIWTEFDEADIVAGKGAASE